MSVRSLRIPEEMELAIEHVASHEKIEKSQALRKLARLGFEVYVAGAYREGRITLRDAASLLGATLGETLELLEVLGVRGNVRAHDVLASLDSVGSLAPARRV